MDLITKCPTRYVVKAGWRRLWHLIFHGHVVHTCGLESIYRTPHDGRHTCGCGFRWPNVIP